MKIVIEKNDAYGAEPEVFIKCREVDEEVKKIAALLDMEKKRLWGFFDQQEHVIEPEEVLYCESVDGVVFIYTRNQVYRSVYTLNETETVFSEFGFFRCSKSMVVNMNSIKSLKSELGNRIDAVLSNGEHIIISRHYVKQFRLILKEVCSL